MGSKVNATHRPLYPRERDPVPIVQEAGWAPMPVWTGAENLAPTGFRSPDRPACRQPLYRLRYPAHIYIYIYIYIYTEGAKKMYTYFTEISLKMCIHFFSTSCIHAYQHTYIAIYIYISYSSRVTVCMLQCVCYSVYVTVCMFGVETLS